MFINEIIAKIQTAQTVLKINNILDIARDNINGLSREEVAKIESEAEERKRELYAIRY